MKVNVNSEKMNGNGRETQKSAHKNLHTKIYTVKFKTDFYSLSY